MRHIFEARRATVFFEAVRNLHNYVNPATDIRAIDSVMASVDPSVTIFGRVWGAKSPTRDGKQRGKEYYSKLAQVARTNP